MTRGITDHYLFQMGTKKNFIGNMFHEKDMDGAYDDFITWEGLGLPQEHFPMQPVNMDGIRPSYGYRILARTWTLGIVLPLEDQEDDLYNIIHRLFPKAGGEFAESYYNLEQILGAQLFGLYGFQTGTGVPFSPNGLSFFNTAIPMSLGNQAQTWSNTTSVAADLSVGTAQIARAQMRIQKKPNGITVMNNPLKRVMVHPNEELIAKQIFQYGEREPNTTDNNRNYIADDNIQIVVNPYFEYSGATGATQTPQAFNSVVFQGEEHWCFWQKRDDLKTYPDFDNERLADVITTRKRFGYGIVDPRGLFGLKGL